MGEALKPKFKVKIEFKKSSGKWEVEVKQRCSSVESEGEGWQIHSWRYCTDALSAYAYASRFPTLP